MNRNINKKKLESAKKRRNGKINYLRLVVDYYSYLDLQLLTFALFFVLILLLILYPMVVVLCFFNDEDFVCRCFCCYFRIICNCCKMRGVLYKNKYFIATHFVFLLAPLMIYVYFWVLMFCFFYQEGSLLLLLYFFVYLHILYFIIRDLFIPVGDHGNIKHQCFINIQKMLA